MPNPTTVRINLNAKDPNIISVICTTYRRVESGMAANKKIKYQKFDSITVKTVPHIIILKHPGRGGLLSILGINGGFGVECSSLRRLKK